MNTYSKTLHHEPLQLSLVLFFMLFLLLLFHVERVFACALSYKYKYIYFQSWVVKPLVVGPLIVVIYFLNYQLNFQNPHENNHLIQYYHESPKKIDQRPNSLQLDKFED